MTQLDSFRSVYFRSVSQIHMRQEQRRESSCEHTYKLNRAYTSLTAVNAACAKRMKFMSYHQAMECVLPSAIYSSYFIHSFAQRLGFSLHCYVWAEWVCRKIWQMALKCASTLHIAGGQFCPIAWTSYASISHSSQLTIIIMNFWPKNIEFYLRIFLRHIPCTEHEVCYDTSLLHLVRW